MSDPKRFRYRLEAFGLRFAGRLFRSMGVDAASRFGGRAWRLLAPLGSRHRRALTHLQIALPELGPQRHREIVSSMWDNLGRVFAESFHLATIAAEPERIDISGAGAIARLAEAPQGCVLVSLHMANWEVAALTLMRFGLKPASPYRRASNPETDAIIRAMREPWYPGGFFEQHADGNDLALKLVRVVRRGGALALLADLRESNGIEVPFFGQPALATPFPALVARRFKVPLVAVRMRRTEDARFEVEVVEIPVPQTDDRETDVQAATAELHRVFEDWIRRDPGQWFWIHRKWAPPGKA